VQLTVPARRLSKDDNLRSTAEVKTRRHQAGQVTTVKSRTTAPPTGSASRRTSPRQEEPLRASAFCRRANRRTVPTPIRPGQRNTRRPCGGIAALVSGGPSDSFSFDNIVTDASWCATEPPARPPPDGNGLRQAVFLSFLRCAPRQPPTNGAAARQPGSSSASRSVQHRSVPRSLLTDARPRRKQGRPSTGQPRTGPTLSFFFSRPPRRPARWCPSSTGGPDRPDYPYRCRRPLYAELPLLRGLTLRRLPWPWPAVREKDRAATLLAPATASLEAILAAAQPIRRSALPGAPAQETVPGVDRLPSPAADRWFWCPRFAPVTPCSNEIGRPPAEPPRDPRKVAEFLAIAGRDGRGPGPESARLQKAPDVGFFP